MTTTSSPASITRANSKGWPHAGDGQSFEFARLIESGDEVVVTYEGRRADGTRFRNTEVLTFVGDRVRRAEVYFGWELT